MSTTAQPQQDMKDILRPYLQANPSLRVNVTVLNWESAWARINAAAESGQGPDLLELGSTWVTAISAKGALEPVPSTVQGLVGGAKQFFPALWGSTHRLNDSQIYAIPWYAGARVAFYRSDLFQHAGIRPNEAFANWGSFKQAMQKLKGIKLDGKLVGAFGYPGKNDWDILHNLAPWIWNAGGDFLNADQTKAIINSPEAMQAIRYFKSFADEGIVPASALERDSAQIEAGFFKGEYAVIFSGPWVLKMLSTDKAKGGQRESVTARNFGVASYPAGIKGNQTFFSGSNLAVMKSSKNKEQAWKLLQFLVSREAQIKYSTLSGMLPARLDALDDPILQQMPHYADFIAQVKLGRHYPVLPAWGKLETVFRTHIAQAVSMKTNDGSDSNKLGALSLKRVLDQAANEADRILKENP
ncbi:sugar ABC transporter substrate-binding protein [Undibacterium sp. LX40W]|uniref:Sugar ABC transporter substrate-binding protein n=1 Tax=Undibacterium nitidum TaxID=2762298 RepID=A0A923KUE2_9BURK|nr:MULTISPECIES: sugar ABC transporter substrate-binding protein [Undibacterium]MBC3883201.1 sugar ABC transporter substrate-binding protein [Undibacterium nitidum]MBC3893483.1 sugar ABC transporter substrate-binding protein [Undibacterium sp. LX40W]